MIALKITIEHTVEVDKANLKDMLENLRYYGEADIVNIEIEWS